MIKNIKVAGIQYQVNEVEKLEEQYNLLGQVLYTRGIIQIDKCLPEDRKEQVLIHEVLHACFYEAGYEEQDEDLINRLGIILHQVLKENALIKTNAPTIEM